ncbi:hypothetical protein H7I53_25980 [Mycolicibacterium pulveris]|uniref:Uncharacterized protein n=1 Tax=Mycolicibacterium pulveris TaxID=36813 RepID=A0A7I7UQA0_MYCPV|nr:DUF1660 family phage protein [Mycolicibacterium pulveris]MCV6983656.1 hypothetical protein [Mycolicibacterium pulveris]BBY83537.1 hypothetical protein MPUL_46950 [Mycolicibacterium pulveris]
MTMACRVFGHQPTFSVHGDTMRWSCERCGQAPGAKQYRTAEEARRYAAAFNKRDTDDLGKRAPLIGLLPLRLWRRLRRE